MTALPFLSQLLTSLSSAALVGFIFWAWLNSRFRFVERIMDEQRERIKDLEEKAAESMSKHDHHHIRKEDKEAIEKQLNDLRKDVKDMPHKIVDLIKPFIK
jgi:DNA-binding ferritin-like protein